MPPSVANALRYLFSRKEREERKQARRSIPQVPPPAYRPDFYDTPSSAVPRSTHPRPLSSFALDYSRQCQDGTQQRPRASLDHPPPYQALPAYDPSRYQPIRPTSIYGADQFSPYTDYNQSHCRGQSSRLSAVHYTEARSSIYQPPPSRSGLYSVSTVPREHGVSHARRQSAMPTRHAGSAERRSSHSGEGRERSASEPVQGTGQTARGGAKKAKPVLSRLITNFG